MELTNRRKWLMTGAAALGVAVGAAGIAGAATTGSSSSSSGSSSSSASAATRPDPAGMPNGPGETVLTGTTAEKVKAAALAAVPGATVIRVETDSDGSPYEAHLQKSDGTYVTVKIDASFAVTATDNGFGGGPHGAPGGPGGYGGYGAPAPQPAA